MAAVLTCFESRDFSTRPLMKRFTRSLFAWALAVAGLLLTGGVAQAALADFAGSYAANLASSEVPPGGGEAVDVFHGRVEFTANAKGGVTGKLQTRAGKSYSFLAKLKESEGTAVVFNAQQANNVGLAKVAGAFTINFSLTINADGTLVINGTNTKVGDANGAFFVSRSYKFIKFTGKADSQPAWRGTYTLALLAPESAGAEVPAGAGYASLSVNPTGKLSYKGKLGDGTSLTGSANPITGAVYSLFVKPPGYAAGGYFLAELDVDQRGALAEPALWTKAAKATDKAYPAGFSTEPTIVIQPWTAPAPKEYPIPEALGLTYSKNFMVDFSGEGLLESDVATLPDTARIATGGWVRAVAGGTGSPAENNSSQWNGLWKNVKLNPKTGVFAGKQVLSRTVNSKTTKIEADVGGVLSFGPTLGSDPFAFGQYAVKTSASTTTGLVTFSGPLEDNLAVAATGTYTVKLRRISLANGVPAGAPSDGATVSFTISEDMKTISFGGVKLPLKSDGRPVSLLYTNAQTSPFKNLSVEVFLNFEGRINGIAAIYNQTLMAPPFLKNAAYQNAVAGTAGFIKQD
jgi:hypothetical protein